MKKLKVKEHEVTKATLMKWINALYSGKANGKKVVQGMSELNPDKGQYCCLGVACLINISKTKLELRDNDLLRGSMPDDQDNAPDWLKVINSDFFQRTSKGLSDLNDSEEYSFIEIADMLYAVYILGVLDEKF